MPGEMRFSSRAVILITRFWFVITECIRSMPCPCNLSGITLDFFLPLERWRMPFSNSLPKDHLTTSWAPKEKKRQNLQDSVVCGLLGYLTTLVTFRILWTQYGSLFLAVTAIDSQTPPFPLPPLRIRCLQQSPRPSLQLSLPWFAGKRKKRRQTSAPALN